jgi:hypothetical protein
MSRAVGLTAFILTRHRWDFPLTPLVGDDHRPRRHLPGLLLCGLAVAIAGCASGAGWDISGTDPASLCEEPPNGCGPRSYGFLIPDCPFGLVCFTEACNGHDLCYRECGVMQSACDLAFRDALEALCTSAFDENDPHRQSCRALAYIYFQAVARFGRPALLATQENCGCLDEPAPEAATAARRLADPPFTDGDDDLLPDDWEQAYGADPTDPRDALEDFDNDGLNTLQEYLFNTDPWRPDPR